MWAPKPLLGRDEVEGLADGATCRVRLSRLWEPEPQVIYEGEATIRRDRTLFNVEWPGNPLGSWAEYDVRDCFASHDSSALVAEDYYLEVLV
jgi:hypothetical protein